MGFLDKEKLGGVLKKAKDMSDKAVGKVAEVSVNATEKAQEAVGKIKGDRISSEEKARLLEEYNEKMKDADLEMVAEVENYAGLAVGDFNFIIDSAVKYKVKKGENTSFPIFSGHHDVVIKYSVVKTKVSLELKQNCILFVALDPATNLMKVELLDMDRNPINDGSIEVDYGKYSNAIKKATVTSESSTSCLDADVRVFGTDGQIYLYDDRVVIEREGAAAKLESGVSASKIIPMSSITGLNYRHRTDLSYGFIHIEDNGKLGINLLTGTNKNKVTLNSNEDVDKVKAYIEARMKK